MVLLIVEPGAEATGCATAKGFAVITWVAEGGLEWFIICAWADLVEVEDEKDCTATGIDERGETPLTGLEFFFFSAVIESSSCCAMS